MNRLLAAIVAAMVMTGCAHRIPMDNVNLTQTPQADSWTGRLTLTPTDSTTYNQTVGVHNSLNAVLTESCTTAGVNIWRLKRSYFGFCSVVQIGRNGRHHRENEASAVISDTLCRRTTPGEFIDISHWCLAPSPASIPEYAERTIGKRVRTFSDDDGETYITMPNN